MTTRTPTAAVPKTHAALRRDLVIALAIKLSLLTAIYYCFFAESHRPNVDPETAAAALLGHSTVHP
jgi:hypothetical protein